ncbi:MAG TPA: glycosyltransferase family 39 protein, partial [Lacipirellulaceae bacterium]|nr:glycosyltransferase family 39 protein [Lacipirellulaceae bacterium]
MKIRTLPAVLTLAFACFVGDFGFRTFNPSLTPEFSITSNQPVITHAGGEEPQKHLYLRKKWSMTAPPERAWIQMIGHDSLEIFVNGRRAARGPLVGYGRLAGQILDVTNLLHAGENSIAVHVPQTVLHRPPAVTIDGQCEFADGSTLSLAGSKEWRAGSIYDRRGAFWYETEFDDRHWAEPTLGPAEAWRAQVCVPPRAITEPRRSQWISSDSSADGAVAWAQTLTVPARPREGWLRIIGTGSHRVAINGWLLTQTEPDLGLPAAQTACERTYDISPLLRAGVNSIAILSESSGESPRIRADVEATLGDGTRATVATDATWKFRTGYVSAWTTPDLTDAEWSPCRLELGYQGVVPRTMVRELVELSPPPAFWFARRLIYFAWVAGACAAAAGGGMVVARLLYVANGLRTSRLLDLPYVALLPSTIAATVGHLMTWDLAWTGRDVYQPLWLLALALAPVMQWLVLLMLSSKATPASAVERARSWGRLPGGVTPAGLAYGLCLLALTVAAFWLRVRNLTAEPIHHDEVTAYAFTDAIFTYGFPGGQVHPDIPFGYCATNELTYYFNALCALFTDDPLLIIRVPAMLFSMGTFFLLAYMGCRWFNAGVGLVAAALFAFSPHAIAMADFGRYLSQVQFFTLLTMWAAYEAVRGSGPPRPGVLWGSAVCFIAMYLSWEGTGMFGIGLGIAALFHRRRHLRTLLASPHLHLAALVVLLVVVGQNAHRIMQQTQRLWYGEGISSLTIKPMWRFPFFQYDYFLTNSGWTRDALLPMIALAIALVMAVGHRWRAPLRFSLICLISNAEVMAALLPVRTNRYSYHLMQIFILIAAAVAVAGADAVLNAIRARAMPRAYRWYSYGVAGAVVLAG